ncbi:MAG: hypothetical protein K940chlam7_00942 [Chlamydiae bacterium]|nr:hypothetical protein [Chlamydiota bacterium]
MSSVSNNQNPASLVHQVPSVMAKPYESDNSEEETEDELTPEFVYLGLRKRQEQAEANFRKHPNITSETLITFENVHLELCEKLDALYEESKTESGTPKERGIKLGKEASRFFNIRIQKATNDFLVMGGSSQGKARNANRDFSARLNCHKKMIEKSCQEMQAEIDKKIKFTAKKLEIAEEKGCPPASVSDEEVEKCLETRLLSLQSKADQFMEELIKEEESKKASTIRKKTKNRKKKKARGKEKQPVVAQKTPDVQEKKQGAVPASISLEEARGQYLASIFLRKKMAELSRVTQRWKTTDPEKTRHFEDKNAAGDVVCRYKKHSDQEITQQRAQHYLPGTERILADPKDRRIYSFPTDRGAGMFAKLMLVDGPKFGILYFGIGEGEVIFHKYFEEFAAGQIQNKNIFDDQTEDSVVHNETLSKEEEGEEWECTVPYNIDASPKGVLTISYHKEAHAIEIFPIRKDLLDPKVFTAS